MDDYVDKFDTIRDLLRYAITSFSDAELHFGHGTDTPLDEAVYLICYQLGLPSEQFDHFLDARLTKKEVIKLHDLINLRVSSRKPAPYLTNEAWLYGFKFFVDERVIIPRSHIAELLVGGLTPWISYPQNIHNILDLCCGSACLAIIAAENFPNAVVDATDISQTALDVAKINIENYHLSDKITLYHGDLFASLPKEKKYDIIIANPPYVSASKMKNLPPEYLAEPKCALASGAKGLDHITDILQSVGEYLSNRGLLFMEIGSSAELMEATFNKHPFTWINTPTNENTVLMLESGGIPEN